MNFELTKRHCSALRGFAITIIVLHNLVHFLPWGLSENEFTFQAARADAFWQYLKDPDALLPLQLLSFLGCHVIHIFFLLSGFGLAMKYETTACPIPSAPRFVWRHYLKLLPLLVLGWLLYLAAELAVGHSPRLSPRDTTALLTMTANLLPHPEQHIWPGPFWFFGVLMQLYVFYRLVLYPLHRGPWRWAAPTLAIVLSVTVSYVVTDLTSVCYLHYNLPMGLPAFCIGLLVGRNAHRLPAHDWRLWSTICEISLILFIAATSAYVLWPLLPIFMAISTISSTAVISRKRRKPLIGIGKVSAGIGMMSAGIFALHPAVRTLLLAPAATAKHPYLACLIMLIISICLGKGYHTVKKQIQNIQSYSNPL